ncbi:MAG: hypothetical protein JO112_10925, partial [Planctomycetes bacterium]|nr:hypothetical protein [Planctomycetota bacterium]
MIGVHRLGTVCAAMTILAMVTGSHVLGGAGNPLREKLIDSGSQSAPDKGPASLAEDLAQSKFARGGIITYQAVNGDDHFALQLQPKLDPVPARPRDVLIMVDTSASQVGWPLRTAQMITEELATKANPADRVAIWTVNIPKATRDLTHGFRGPPQVQEALK